MQFSDLEARLREAQARQREAMKEDVPLEERVDRGKAVLQAERTLSLARGEETALPCEWEYLWDFGDPSPHVLSSGLRTFLVYRLNEWKKPRSLLKEMSNISAFAIVNFTHCIAHKLSNINEEVLSGHSLWGKGLAMYGVHMVMHSHWLSEAQRVHMVHYRYDSRQWESLKHYLLVFHDNIFECLAEGYTVEVLQDSLEHVTEIARMRLLD